MKKLIYFILFIIPIIGILLFSIHSCINEISNSSNSSASLSDNHLNIYWGDIHNHCNLTYGHGDMRSAFEAAKQQLDFVSVTPHAMWPDIPGKDDPRLSWVIDYHVKAFERLRKNGWPIYTAMTKEYNEEGKFLTFISYEMHSMKYGDHVALFHDLNAPLVEGSSIPDLKDKLKNVKAFVTPHHMGYQNGYRGYSWDFFKETEQTQFVEIFSRHGLAESDQGDFNYLHDMGPRIYEGSALYGLEKGYKFGMIGSTDQHAGYPGSYGDGRVAVLAKSLTRDEIWNALKQRHVYCTTGEKILLNFRINEAIMGDVIKSNRRNIYLKVQAENYIDYVDIIKNGKRITRLNGSMETKIPEKEVVRAKIKINFGWNRSETVVRWDNLIEISDGKINNVSPCFRGAAYTSPQENKIGHEDKTNVNKILNKSDSSVVFELYTTKNPNTLTPAMQGVILDVTMPKSGLIRLNANNKEFSHTLNELFEGTKAHFMNGWLSEAVQFERAVPESNFIVEYSLKDDEPERDTDYYYIRVRQRDGHAAWSTPIWVEKSSK